ncbi:hypothetical protein A0128_07410 [Leptospira tipperaryensis]|uniref:Transferase n=1 Tax=Leptospira tipperaryensis TaxID=2564040 RepID=A0A1D7UVV9_9LEPT|nr:LA_1612 family putative O-antigen biosynthesis protein [Leptospira tipperaryensis]AOP33684.1 hypothetical protein A0128_07410 [Leptospira tipperaryensis]
MFIKIKNRIINLLTFFLFSKKEWGFPRKSDLLFYDASGYEFFKKYIDSYNPVILYTRGEILNIPIFLLSLSKGFNIQNYFKTYISFVCPKLILTFIDNDPNFYELKAAHPEVATMFVQNGFRGEIGDIFGYLSPKESYNVDYMLTFGEDIGAKYNEYIKGKSVPIGSFKNNLNPVGSYSNLINQRSILFISQYISPPSKKDELFFVEPDGSTYSWEQFYEAEFLLLPALKKFCQSRNKSIQVCGRSKKKDIDESNFYNGFFDGLEWSMTTHSSSISSYELIDSAELIVFIDSTLGYEALARGKKAAAFPLRCKSLRNDSYRFGWPSKFSESGPYWANEWNEDFFLKKLGDLDDLTSTQWKRELESTRFSKVMDFDPGNSKFTSVVRNILQKSE